ncbi:hypothetical protein KAR91_23385 [Candidatus Pacearchaeota archaeon]|nr:hypothetical protein [Candidatus Pacearchaeota archaeon]
MAKEMTEYFCLDCNKLLDQPIPGIIAEAWLRTDGSKDIVKAVPGGIQYGKELGLVCNACHDKNYRIDGGGIDEPALLYWERVPTNPERIK